MSEHSPAQKQYLLRVKREKNLIRVSRILLFLGFLILWEVSARFGWIDSFIFSSPSEIWINFLKMLKDQSLFTHIGITLAETLVSFVFTVLLGIGTAVLLWTCPRLSHVLRIHIWSVLTVFRNLHLLLSSSYGWVQIYERHRCRNLRCNLWLHH